MYRLKVCSLQSLQPPPNVAWAFKRKLITYPRCCIGKVSSSETRGEYSIGSSQSSRFFGGGQPMHVVGVSRAARSGPQWPPSWTPLRQTGVKALAFLQMAGPPFFVAEATTRGQTEASWRSTLAPALQSSSHLQKKSKCMKSSGTIEKYWGHEKDQWGEIYLLEILVAKAANVLISTSI